MLESLAQIENHPADAFPKTPTGIDGLDAITLGGLPSGRPTLICGGAGCGKTLMAMEFLIRGAVRYGEPGVFLAFEESRGGLARNVASLGFDREALARSNSLVVEYLKVDRANPGEGTGDYDLEGLFIRLQSAIESIGAKRVAID